MSKQAFCIACRNTDDIENLYHLVDDDAYIHKACLTQEWADKLDLDVDADNIANEPTPPPALPTTTSKTVIRIVGVIIMAAALLGALGIGVSNTIVSVHYSVLFATLWLTGLAMLLR